jgi:hypothetical protein
MVSADSAAFGDVLAQGEESPSYPMFLTMSSVFPGATEAELARIYRPRPGMPFTRWRRRRAAQRSGVGLDINRHYYDVAEVEDALQRPVVASLLALCRFRNLLAVFDGDVAVSLAASRLTLGRQGVAEPAASAVLVVDLDTGGVELDWVTGEGVAGRSVDLRGEPPVLA